MIEINLLPIEYKRKKIQLPDLGKLRIIPIAISVIGFLIGLYLILSIILTVKTNTLNRLNNEWQSILNEKQEADKLKQEVKRLKKKADLIDSLLVDRLLWSKKLNQLSDLMIDGIWLESLTLGERKEKPTLILKGNVVSRKKEETALIGQFMERLRQDEDFFSCFQDIELESIKRRQLGKTEVMEFNLILFLAEKNKKITE
jgi:Tfp pilus assembly protein PilN